MLIVGGLLILVALWPLPKRLYFAAINGFAENQQRVASGMKADEWNAREDETVRGLLKERVLDQVGR